MPTVSPSLRPDAAQVEPDAWFWSVIRGARRDWRLMLAIIATVAVTAVIFTKRQHPVYESVATLLFQQKDRSMSLVGQMAQLDPRQAAGGSPIETDMAVLKSRLLGRMVADSLGLALTVLEPAVGPGTVFQTAIVSDQVQAGVYELVREASGTYRLDQVVGGRSTPVERGIVPGRVVSTSGFTFTLAASGRTTTLPKIRFAVSSPRVAADRVRNSVIVSRPDPRANIVSIQYRSEDPALAAAIPNVLADAFIRYKQRTTRTESSTTVDFLREQVASYERELQGSESRLQAFREQNNIVSLEDEATEQVTRLAELQARREQVNTEATSLRRLLAEAELGSRGSAGEVSYRRLASFPAFFSNKAVQDILSSLMVLENTRGELLVRRTSENIDVQGINQRVSDLENQLYQMARSYLASLDSQRASMDAELGAFGNELRMVPAREIQFARLARDRELLANMYTLLQTRLKEAEIGNAAQVGDVQILDPATVPQAPISPRPMYNLLIALVLGAILASVTVLVRNALDRTVRTRDQALALTGGIPLLGAIPRLPATPAGPSRNGRHLAEKLNPARLLLPAPSNGTVDSLVSWRAPESVASEAFRGLRASVALASSDRPVQVVMVTSAMAGDGKSTSSANLAITYAQQGLRTLLLDADLRNGTLRHLVDAPQGPGLSEVLMGRATAEESILELRVGEGESSLYFLGAGARPQNAAGLLGSARLPALLSSLRAAYDVIVIDVPPLAGVTDALVLGKHVDFALLVARLGHTDREALEESVLQLQRINVPFEGLVLNDAPLPNRYYSYAG
jgi:polysaccharide biosynthesis transport protein